MAKLGQMHPSELSKNDLLEQLRDIKISLISLSFFRLVNLIGLCCGIINISRLKSNTIPVFLDKISSYDT